MSWFGNKKNSHKNQNFQEISLESFAGFGVTEKITDLPNKTSLKQEPIKEKLGVWRSTAICGNDISSSVLYVSALCAAQAGVLAPIVLLVVSLVLYLFRRVYAEVGSALPLNGGTYTVLLNTTNKKLAAGAACLTLLSYIATAVISANEAMHYAHHLFEKIEIIPCTVILLGIFAILNIVGISESAMVALVIFVIHIVTLSVLAISGIISLSSDTSLLNLNWSLPDPEGIFHALFFGFAAAMLGISGFESSANFIEEQKQGVFPKTLRNMWIIITVFNPLISLLSLALLPLAEIQTIPADLLAQMGKLTLGQSFASLISLDATLVLSGAVLTSYVGVTGLVRRMSLDRCLPQFLLKQNPWTKTNHWIIIGFFLLCTSILLVTKGDLSKLAGVYSLSFLSVMGFFAFGNILLKQRRSSLKREIKASWPTVVLALISVVIGFIGNALMDTNNFLVFIGYFLLAWLVVVIMFLRLDILRLILFLSSELLKYVQNMNDKINKKVQEKITEINSSSVVFFTRGGGLPNLNKAALYVLENEETNNMKVVHVYENEKDIPKDLEKQIEFIDKIYPQLKIDFITVKGKFSSELIYQLSHRLNIPKNMMFIGSPGDQFPHNLEDLGGVRVIL